MKPVLSIPRSAFTHARIYHSLRTAHLERAHLQVPATIYFHDRRYDFDADLANGLDLIAGGNVKLLLSLLRSRIAVLEVNEPLQRSGLLRSAIGISAVRLAGKLRRKPVLIVSYAIENLDPYAGSGPARLKSRIRMSAERFLSGWVGRQLDRVAFGTQSAADLYAEVSDLAKAQTKVIPALPAPCDCEFDGERDNSRVLFLGAFQERKGFPDLLAAWPGVLELNQKANLTLVGKGAMEDSATRFSRQHPSVELLVDPPRAEVHNALRRAALLVLLSQPNATWREQVGLPIVEALAHGCKVLTTDQTGLAAWLGQHGHGVIAVGAEPADIAAAINLHLVEPREIGSVLADLPALDGRLSADRWLLRPNALGTSDEG